MQPVLPPYAVHSWQVLALAVTSTWPGFLQSTVFDCEGSFVHTG